MYRIEIHMTGCETILLSNQTDEQVVKFRQIYHADSIAPITLNPIPGKEIIINRQFISWVDIEESKS